MVLKDTTDPGDENFDAPSARRASPFGQSLPRTAPVPNPADERLKKRHKALFNVPDWRSEEEIILEAAELDSTIMVPERLRRTKPKTIDSGPARTAANPSQSAEIEAPTDPAAEISASSATTETTGDETVYPKPGAPTFGAPASSPETKQEKIANPPGTASANRPSETAQNPIAPGRTQRISQPSEPRAAANRPAKPTGPRSPVEIANIAARLLGNLLVLMIPTLCVLLLSGWGPQEIAIIFEDFWPYLGLSLLVTVVLVILDEAAQAVALRVGIPQLLEWMIEFVLSALGAGVCLFFFTHSVLGAFLLGLIVSVLTSLISHVVAKLF